MIPPRMYGRPPHRVVLVHGGPGAAGEMAPVARELAAECGVLEPFQTAHSVQEQVKELGICLETYGNMPSVLVGYSWGAWLSYLLAAQAPSLVRKLILVSSAGFTEESAQRTADTRWARMSPEQAGQVRGALERLQHSGAEERRAALEEIGRLFSRIDAYDPVAEEAEPMQVDAGIYQSVWPEAADMRRSGALLEAGRSIACPVVVIHGAHDPHPAAGVCEPLGRMLRNLRCVILPECGHVPWREKRAARTFFQALRAELQLSAAD